MLIDWRELRDSLAVQAASCFRFTIMRVPAMKAAIIAGCAVLFLATATAHAEYETMQGIDWKCPGGLIVRFDRNGGKYEKGSTETVVITALQERRLTRWHLVWSNKAASASPF